MQRIGCKRNNWVKKVATCVLIVFTFFQSSSIYAQELATPSATEATSSMTLDQQEATASAVVETPVSTQSAVITTPTPTPEILLGPSGVLSSSASIRQPPSIRPMTKRTFRAGEVASVVVENIDISTIKATVRDTNGVSIETTPSVDMYDGGVRVMFIPKTSFKPGKYTIIVEDTTTGTTLTQDFLWGVLAFNTDQATYAPGDTATIALAVLDEKGMMVCDADVTLTILSPTRVKTTLTTEDGSIRVTPECKLHAFTLKPDYETTFQTSDEGVYAVTLTAKTNNGIYSIEDSFQASSDMPFQVKRSSATRIYPPEAYPMIINITANEDFTGVVTETVPESFTITPLDGSIPYADVKTVVPDTESHTPILLGMPFEGNYPVTLGFGERIKDPLLKSKYEQFGLKGHDGADFAMPEGTQIFAVDSGKVVRIADQPYGTTVVIDHTWGRSYYGHLSVVQVKVGDAVAKGTPIALSGKTGLTTGSHLHFGMKFTKNNMENGYYGKIDPMPYVTSSVTYQSDSSGKQISWNVSVKKDEKIRLGYTYKAPGISPQFYLLGPLTFRATKDVVSTPTVVPDNPFVLGVATDSAKPQVSVSKNITYQEARQWQIASDAVTYITTGAINQDTTDPVSVVPVPPTHQAGDILIASAFNKSGADTVTATEGWVEIGELYTFDGLISTNWWWKRATAAGTAGPEITSATGDVYAVVHVVRGVTKTGTPYEDATVTGNNTAPETTPDSSLITTTGANRLAVCFLNRDDDHLFTSGWPPALWTNRYELGSSTGTDGGFAVMDRAMATAGDVAAVVIGTWGATEMWGSLTLAFIQEVSPTVALNTPTDTQTITDTTPDLVFTGTDANSDEIEYNVQVDTVNTFDSVAETSTYYFDGSDAAATDPNNVWTNDANAFDGNTATYANTTSAGTTSINYLMAEGTNSPASGGTIAQVRARLYTSTSWGAYVTLTVPGGGWTWAGIQALEVKTFYDSSTDGQDATIYTDGLGESLGNCSGSPYGTIARVEIEVTLVGIPLLDKNSVDHTGFAGTGDPHPWPSGNAVTYTVQSALTAGTYYWRVRGKDPLGSNTYGAWSSPTWSFTMSSAGPTTDQQLRHGTWFSSGVKQAFTF